MKIDLFQSCGHCWVFQICCHIECSTFTASSFRIWNSSTGISSPPLYYIVNYLYWLIKKKTNSRDLWDTIKQYNICVIGIRGQGQGLLFSPLYLHTLTQILTQQRPGGKLSPFFFLCYLRTLTYVDWKNNSSAQKCIERALFLQYLICLSLLLFPKRKGFWN